MTDRTLGDLLENAARRWPDTPGLVFPAFGSLTFKDLAEQSDELANTLWHTGVRHGDKVGVLLRNRPEFALSWLALAKLGACMVPVNTRFTAAEAAYVLDHSRASLLITERHFAPLVDELRTSLPQIWSDDAALSGSAPKRPDTDDRPAASDVLNVQYTSGTTAQPKGCLLTHDYWVRIAEEMTRADEDGRTDLAIRHGDRLLTAQPLYYMDPQWQIASILHAGATLTVLDGFHPSTFWQDVREHNVTIFYCLGAMPTLLLKMPPAEEDTQHGVRAILCSAIPRKLHAQLETRWATTWHELYGMTETGVDIRVRAYQHDGMVGSGCLGLPGVGREAAIIDEHGDRVPAGHSGELALHGRSLMLGYYRDPDATAAVFTSDGWLRTGDLASMDESGNVYFEGRAKQMVRRAGENISAAQVEDVLALHPQVAQAACVAVPDPLRGEEVMAYVRRTDLADSVTAAQLSHFAAGHLAMFKVPRYWMFTDHFPTTPSERVAKKVLIEQTIGDPVYDRSRNELISNPFQSTKEDHNHVSVH